MVETLKLYYSMHQNEKDPAKRIEIKSAMKQILQENSFIYAPPRGYDDKFTEIMKFLGYKTTEVDVNKYTNQGRFKDEFADVMEQSNGKGLDLNQENYSISKLFSIQSLPLLLPEPKG